MRMKGMLETTSMGRKATYGGIHQRWEVRRGASEIDETKRPLLTITEWAICEESEMKWNDWASEKKGDQLTWVKTKSLILMCPVRLDGALTRNGGNLGLTTSGRECVRMSNNLQCESDPNLIDRNKSPELNKDER